MIAAIVLIFGITVVGIAIARAAGGRAPLAGLGFLYGTGAVYAAMMLLPWRLTVIVGALLAVGATLYMVTGFSPSASSDGLKPVATSGRRAISTLADILTTLTLVGYTLFATLAAPWAWDFNAIWGLKARVFFEHGGVDWRFLQSPWNDFAHPDYPLLVPMNFDFLALASGGWNDRWIGLLFVAFAIALVLVVRQVMADEFPQPVPALITFAVAGLACTRYVGLAEGALAAFATAGILMLRRGESLHAALLLGLAASTKQEGGMLLVTTVIALLLARRWRDAIRLWPAFVIAAPWWITAATMGLRSDLAVPGALHRAAAHMSSIGEIVHLLATWTADPILWLLIAAAILVALRREEAPYLVIVIVQFAGLIAAYVTTPYGLHWHISTSWPRLTRQLAPIATILALILLAKTYLPEEDHAHAEAGLEH
jgi:hypothetical protein